MCVDKQWPFFYWKTVSLLLLNFCLEKRRILDSRNQLIMVDSLSSANFWKILEEAFIKLWNITFGRHVFLITKQLRGETVELFYDNSIELAENCDFKNKEEMLIEDVFISNLIDGEVKKKLVKKTLEAKKTLEPAINTEIGMQREHQKQAHNKALVQISVNTIQ